MKKKYDILKHELVPKHSKLSVKEKKELFDTYNISERELPRILKSDTAIANLNVDIGTIIKIIRKSKTAGEAVFYRVVCNG